MVGMGIGVKYYSGNTKRSFTVDGVPPAGSELDGFVRHSQDLADAANQRARVKLAPRKTMPNVGDLPGFSGEKLCGSLVESMNGKTCLAGEENELPPEGQRVYATVNGQKGWRTLDEIDVSRGCVRIGPEVGYSDVEADTSTGSQNGAGFEFSVSNRVVLTEEDIAGVAHQVVYAFSRTLRFTPGGRLFEIGPEKRQKLGILRGGGGGSSAEWAITPTFAASEDDPDEEVLTSLKFKKAGEVDESGNPVDHVVAVEPCDQ